MKSAICSAILLFSFGLFAESNFPSQMANPAQTGVADAVPVTKAKLKWKVALPEILSHQSVPTVVDPDKKSIYLSPGGSLLKIDIETGKITANEKGRFLGNPTISGKMLYITGADFLKAFDISTEKPVLSWTFKTPAAFDSGKKSEHAHRSGPLVTDKLVLFGQGRGESNSKLFAVNIDTGKAAWVFDCKGGLYSLVAWDAKDNLAFCAGKGQGLFAVDLATGKEIWNVKIETSRLAGPAFADGIVYCAGDKELLAFSAKDGKELLRAKRKTAGTEQLRKDPIGHSMIVDKELLVVNAGSTVEAYARKDGAFVWKYKAKGEGAGFMAAARDVLYIPDFVGNGYVHGVNMKDGKGLWSFPAPDSHHKCDYVGISDGKVYFSSLGSNLYCLENDTAEKGK